MKHIGSGNFLSPDRASNHGHASTGKHGCGIPTAKRSAFSLCIISVAFCVIAVFTFFATACQPTPESEIVVNKGDGVLEAAALATPLPDTPKAAPYAAPERYSDSQTFYDGKLAVEFDMEIEIPDVSGYPIYKAAPADFSQEQVDRMVAALMQGQPLTYDDQRETKEEITERRLLPAKQKLAEARAGKTVSDDGGPKSIEDLEAYVAMIEQWIVNAPEHRDEKEMTPAEYSNADALYVKADLGKPLPATLHVSKIDESGYSRGMEFIDGVSYIYNGFGRPAEELPIKTTREEAISLASELVHNMGAEDFKVAAVGKTTRLGSEYDIGTEEYQNTMAYSVVFTRVLDGIPFTYTPIDQPGIDGEDQVNVMPPDYERIMVIVDDSGIANVFWKGNTAIGDKVNGNVALLPFETVAARAMEQSKVQYAYLIDAERAKYETVKTDRIELSVGKAQLGYMRVRAKDAADYMIVPVWDFYGKSVTHYNQEDVEALNAKNGHRMDASSETDYAYRAILTINAIDGSVIERNLGY